MTHNLKRKLKTTDPKRIGGFFIGKTSHEPGRAVYGGPANERSRMMELVIITTLVGLDYLLGWGRLAPHTARGG